MKLGQLLDELAKGARFCSSAANFKTGAPVGQADGAWDMSVQPPLISLLQSDPK